MTPPRGPILALAGALLLATLAGCGGRGTASPAPAGGSAAPSATAGSVAGSGSSSRSSSRSSSDGSSGGADTDSLTGEDVATVERAVREAGGTLGQADRQLAGD